ncbi:MAG: hypothetical protein EBU90_12300 [Proteobacteria bacterium]|jgi:hypothetical protein|nr:hypothetical protein [Pseudomonadota bacterium]
MLDLDKWVDVLVKYDISGEELTYLLLIYNKRFDLVYKYSNFTPKEDEVRPTSATENMINQRITLTSKYGVKENVLVNGNRSKRAINTEMVLSLAERGLIEQVIPSTKNTFQLDYFEVTEKLAKEFFFEIDKHIDELYEAYPTFILIDGKQAFLTSADRNLMSILYAKNIKRNIDTHNEVIAKIKANYDNINMKIENFIKSKMWEKLSIVDNNKVEKVSSL